MRGTECVVGVAIVAALLVGCGSSDSGEKEPETVEMVAHHLEKKVLGDPVHLTIEAPKSAEPEEYLGVGWNIFAGKWFKVQVVLGDNRPLLQHRKQLKEQNVEAVELVVDDKDSLLARVQAHGEDRWEVVVIHELETAPGRKEQVLCQSVPPVGMRWTQAQAERMLASCRSLSVAK